MLYDQIQETLAYLRARTDAQPHVALILGTGLGGVADELTEITAFDYANLPHFPRSTVESHRGQLLFGKLAGVPVVCMAGRFHYYEGYTMQQVTFPVRVMRALGAERLIISNAAGGTNPDYRAGDLVFIRDHINLQPENPLRGANDERLGPRFPDMLRAYDRAWNQTALEVAAANGIRAHEGVYLGLQGPNLETPAEYEYIHRIGGDVVGMSTVPEVLVGVHAGFKIFVVSVVTNQCIPLEQLTPTTIPEVIAVARAAEPKMALVVKHLLHEKS